MLWIVGYVDEVDCDEWCEFVVDDVCELVVDVCVVVVVFGVE